MYPQGQSGASPAIERSNGLHNVLDKADILVAFLRDGEKPTEQVTQLAPVPLTRNNVGEAERIGEVK
jgi:hypothetical protein